MLGQAYLEQKMRTWRRSLAGLLLLAGLGPVSAAQAGMLVEALFDDVPLRLETGSDHVDGRPDASATPPGVAAAGPSAALASDNPPDPRAAAGVGRGAPQEAGR